MLIWWDNEINEGTKTHKESKKFSSFNLCRRANDFISLQTKFILINEALNLQPKSLKISWKVLLSVFLAMDIFHMKTISKHFMQWKLHRWLEMKRSSKLSIGRKTHLRRGNKRDMTRKWSLLSKFGELSTAFCSILLTPPF